MFAERGETLVCRPAKIAEKLRVSRRFRHEAHRGGRRAYSETMVNKLTERIQRAASRCSMAAGSGTNIHEGLRGACGTDVRQDASAEESTDANSVRQGGSSCSCEGQCMSLTQKKGSSDQFRVRVEESCAGKAGRIMPIPLDC